MHAPSARCRWLPVLAAGLLLAGTLGVASAQPQGDCPPPRESRDRMGPPGEHDRRGPHFRGERNGPRHGPGFRRAPRTITAEDLLAAEQFAEQHLPEQHAEMLALRSRDPEAADALLRRFTPKLLQFQAILERDPAVGELVIEDFALELSIREAQLMHRRGDLTAAEKAELEADLKVLIEQKMTVRMELQELQLDRLEARIAARRAEIAQRRGNLSEASRAKMEQLLSQDRNGHRSMDDFDRPLTPPPQGERPPQGGPEGPRRGPPARPPSAPQVDEPMQTDVD